MEGSGRKCKWSKLKSLSTKDGGDYTAITFTAYVMKG